MAGREKSLMQKTLVCLIQSLVNVEGKVRIDFRDDTSVTGKVIAVDAYMNVEMEDCTYEAPTGQTIEIKKHMCQGKYIRYVHIPDEVDPIAAIEDRLQILAQAPPKGRGRGRGRGGRGRGGRGGGHFSRGGGGGSSRYGGDYRGGGGGSSRYGGDYRGGSAGSSRYGGDHRSGSSSRYGGDHHSGSSYHSGGSYAGSSSRYDRSRY
ncbi:U7 snRNA-associated Sm-like protein LSm10 isoform X1 [Argiope bruennichi]|uniref:U7 snRNA-associated Sm-like protein LSm10 isoform X1 n=1 Tax=Argiope bruennichi TaxID=94029 RepID=UPI002494338F|nr:U7 snRNA-associated Sm-like protein LSm10 isoform X1 [Argiope bruennichi]